MPAGGEKVAFGRYTMTHDGVAIGITGGGRDGVPTIHQQIHGTQIRNTDVYGDSAIDAIYRGADVSMSLILKEWDAQEKIIIWPFTAVWGLIGLIGQSFFENASAIVLTTFAGVPTFTYGPATLTASKAIYMPGHRVSVSFGPVERDLSVVEQLYPYDTGGGTVGFFTHT